MNKDMVYNPAYGHILRPALVGEIYEQIDSTRSGSFQLQKYPQKPVKSLQQKPNIENGSNLSTRLNVALPTAGIGVVLAIVLATIAMIVVGVLYTSLSSSSQEIQSLEAEIQILREMLNTQGMYV